MWKLMYALRTHLQKFVLVSLLSFVGTGVATPPTVVLPVPDLSAAQFLGYNLGHRPCRTGGPRLEPEWLENGKLLIHNYGHGGAGFSLSWGYAQEVMRVIAEQVALKKLEKPSVVAVIGAGVIGMTVAHTLLEQGYSVRLYADAFALDTTANVATGIFSSSCGATGANQIIAERAKAYSASLLEEIAVAEVPTFKGIHKMEGYSFTETTMLFAASDDMRMIVFGDDSQPETARLGRRFEAVVTDVPVYLQDLFEQIKAKGVQLESKHFANKEEVAALGEPIIINCSGMGSKKLFGDDAMHVDRGEVLYFKVQPGINYILCCHAPSMTDEGVFILMVPGQNRIIVSGSHEGVVEHGEINEPLCNKLYTNIQHLMTPQAEVVPLSHDQLKPAIDCNAVLRPVKAN